mmetsp:Transcript_22181/g.37144  ORF Transcript_22181/g.37144 Transcript_22181/m.37144 type:complete len:212 (+) Transcript_22181:86-721(+)
MSGKNRPPPTPQEIARQSKKDLKRSDRELEREIAKLKRDELQIEQDIRNQLKRGQQDAARRLAKELVRNRDQQEKMKAAQTRLSAVSHRTTSVAASATLGSAMGTATRALAIGNHQLDAMNLPQTMQQYQMLSERMDMTDEMLDDMFDDSDQEEETDEILQQVFDDIGLDIKGKMAATPSTRLETPEAEKEKPSETNDAELNRMLRELMAP